MIKIVMEDIKFNKKTRHKEETPVPKIVKKTVIPEIKVIEPLEEEKPLPVKIKKERKSITFPKFKKRMRQTPDVQLKTRSVCKFLMIILWLTVLFGLIYWGGNIFHTANVTITSKHQIITYKNKIFNAVKNNDRNSVDFEIMITSDKKEKDFILTESKEVSNKSSGSITLYNTFSTKAERLLAGTYITDSLGKTYRLNKVTTIPGYKTENKKIIPGQTIAEITSFLAGESYNGSPDKFYINSFKGTAKYSKVYGELKTPLVGGMQGLVYYITNEDKAKLEKIAQSSLKDDLYKQVKALTPSGYILYPGAINFSYKIDEDILSETPETKVKMEGTLSVVLINEKSLLENIIRVSLSDVTEKEKQEIQISNLNALTFGFVDKNQVITKDTDTLSFYFNGDIEAVWFPNIESLKAELVGVHQNEVLPIFRKDKGITKAIVKIFPPWKKFVPNNPLKINIIIK